MPGGCAGTSPTRTGHSAGGAQCPARSEGQVPLREPWCSPGHVSVLWAGLSVVSASRKRSCCLHISTSPANSAWRCVHRQRFAHTYVPVCVCVCKSCGRGSVSGIMQPGFHSPCATTPLAWKLTHASSDANPLPRGALQKKSRKREKKREREENPRVSHEDQPRALPQGPPASGGCPRGPRSWVTLLVAFIPCASGCSPPPSPCCRCDLPSPCLVFSYMGCIYQINSYRHATLPPREPGGDGYLLPARP